MSIFSKFLSPKLAVKIIRGQLESQISHPIESFTLMYIASTDILQFEVDGTYAQMDAPQIKKILHEKLKDYVKSGQILDVITATADKDNKVTAYLYYTENGIKQKVKFDL
jgi:hypothetical protein